MKQNVIRFADHSGFQKPWPQAGAHAKMSDQDRTSGHVAES
jgi:hypothetical protein